MFWGETMTEAINRTDFVDYEAPKQQVIQEEEMSEDEMYESFKTQERLIFLRTGFLNEAKKCPYCLEGVFQKVPVNIEYSRLPTGTIWPKTKIPDVVEYLWACTNCRHGETEMIKPED